MFKRRARRSFRENVRHAVWPRSGWRRAGRYLWKRLLRLTASPHGVAAGAAAGVFAGCTPLIGLHVLLGLGLAWLVRGNLFAAAAATLLANPLTIPVILAADFEIGSLILATEGNELAAGEIGRAITAEGIVALWPVFRPLLLGGLALGTGAAVLTYAAVRPAVAGFQRRRRLRFGSGRAIRTREGLKP